jgi:SAM-dependent methyltransferase
MSLTCCLDSTRIAQSNHFRITTEYAMIMPNQLPCWLYEPRVLGLDLDDERLPEVHSAIMNDKKLLQSAYQTFYRDMANLCDRFLPVSGLEIELGSGAGFFRKLRPGLVTSDVRRGSNIDLVLDAQNMAVRDHSVRCVYAINVFHHLPDPDRFLTELCRVLRPGGGCILMEPHGGFGSAFLHRLLVRDERFDPDAPTWQNTEITGPLSEAANQALAYIVFERDFDLFATKYGDRLRILHRAYCLNALRFIFSGGINFRQLIPSASEYILRAMELVGRPVARFWTLQQAIVLQRQ